MTMPEQRIPLPPEPTAIRVPGFDVTWPKVVALAGAIFLSVAGGFWGLSNTIYQGLKDKVDRNETKNDSLDALTSTIREGVAKQSAQLTDLDRSVTQIADQIKIMTATLSDTRDKTVAIDAKLSAALAQPHLLSYSPSGEEPDRKSGSTSKAGASKKAQ